MSNKIMIIGAGEVGGNALESLARTPGITHLYLMDKDADKAARKVACSTYGAMFEGYSPKIEALSGDVFRVNEISETLARIKPDVVINAASLQSWWVIGMLPEDAHKYILGAGIGPWIPMHLAPTYNAMKALKASGIDCKVVSLPIPDAVNAVLKSEGLEPTIGAGNVDELIPPIEKHVATEEGVPLKAVQVYVVGHHFHNAAILEWRTLMGAPFYMKILVDDRDVTDRYPAEATMLKATKVYPLGKDDSSIIASSAVKNALAILNDTGLRTHAPGPLGLPGGYPVRIDADGAEVVLPEGLSLAEAVKINQETQKFDGIESIEEDGTVVITDKAYNIMKETLGYECKRFGLGDVEEAARELGRAYKSYASKVMKQ